MLQQSLVTTCLPLMECPKCGSYGTEITDGPSVFDDCMHIRQICYDCGHAWTGVYSLPERLGVEDEEDHELPEYDDSEDIQ